ncbi:MAG: DNA-directed RNA polymerase subunit H [Candidatus Nanoarchaeia archaeon]
MADKNNSTTHVLVPKHEKLTQDEVQQLCKRYFISVSDLPSISIRDPAIIGMDVQLGDVIKITRKSLTAKQTVFYRGVANE